MATVNYNLRIDEGDKQVAEQVFRDLGMTFSTGVNIYIKAVGRQQRIPFTLALDEGGADKARLNPMPPGEEKWKAFMELEGCLAGHDVDLDKERTERILSR